MTPQLNTSQVRAVIATVRAFLSRAGLGAIVALCLLAGPAGATPVHPFLPELSLDGSNTPAGELDRACGVAVDSEGDIYTASAASGKIDVFDPVHSYLMTISNSNEPCGLAVDGKGNLYASNSKTGNVVKYTPNTYPFSGTPTYGAPVTVDSSGKAKGIAVDPNDDSLYVAEGGQVTIYKSDGTLFTGNEVQALVFTGKPSGGTFKLSFKGQETAPIPFNAPATGPGSIQEALEKLSTIGAGNVSLSGGPERITFTSALAATDEPQITVDASSLIGSGTKIETMLQGFTGHLGEGELANATGVVSYTSQGAGAFHQRRYISVADAATDEIKVFIGRMSIGGTGGFPGTLEPPRPIDGTETPAGNLGLASSGTYLGVDPTSGHLYSLDAQHSAVDEFEANGRYLTQISHSFSDAKPTAIAVKPQWDEAQQVRIDASGGSFTLEFEGEETPALAHNLSATKVQEALEALPAIGQGNVSVLGDPVYRIAFIGSLGEHDVGQLSVDESSLSGDDPQIPGTGPSAAVVTLKQGYGPGAVYVTSGAGANSEALAFGPLPDPTRALLAKPHSFEFDGACGTVVDTHGDLYVAGKTGIGVFAPEPSEFDGKGNPKPLALLPNLDTPCFLAVDSEGNLYAEESGSSGNRVALYKPQAYPPTTGTAYSGPTIVEEGKTVRGLAVNPANDHLFATSIGIVEYDSAKEGSAVLDPEFGGKFFLPSGIDVCGTNGDVYVIVDQAIHVLDASGTKTLAIIDGAGSPRGAFQIAGGEGSLAVDQSNCHVFLGSMAARGAVEEFDASGTFVGEFGSGTFSPVNGREDVAVDNSGGPNDGELFAAQFKTLSAFGPLTYGASPATVSGVATEFGGGEATLNGSVDPRGFELTECKFEYLLESEYVQNLEETKPAFEGAEEAPCVPGLAEIGKVTGAVAVHARIGGLDPEGRYRFRLFAMNKFGPSEEGDEAGLFGPPRPTTKRAQPILYREATLHGKVDPSGLATKYRFEYGTDESYGQSTPVAELAAGSGPIEVEAPVTGLLEGTEYHFRIVAENEDAMVPGLDERFETLEKLKPKSCPNETLRLENSSSHLPDCRAYELVTPADTHGASPVAEGAEFNNWLVTPGGPLAGESLAFFLQSTLPGTEGNGSRDGLRATRGGSGWSSALFSPSSMQSGKKEPIPEGVSPDQLYSFWNIKPGAQATALIPGHYLRTPGGFEAVGQGGLGEDLEADGHYVSAGGSHVIFSSREHLEEEAAPQGTAAIYDRAAGATNAKVVSVKPDGSSFGAGEGASYEGATPDGSSVVFSVGGTLYLRHGGETFAVAGPPASFAGISVDGKRVFYTDSADPKAAATLYAFDVAGQSTVQIASNAKFVNVSADGSHAYFVSEGNLEAWDNGTAHIVAALDAKDLRGGALLPFPSTAKFDSVALDSWTSNCVKLAETVDGYGFCPSRATPQGRFLIFQSHADLTPPFQSQGHSEVYRYDALEESLLCISCDPSGAPATADADLQPFEHAIAPATASTVISSVTEDGTEVFFDTSAALLPEDANSALDVYEWLAPETDAQGADGCTRPTGCLALVSSGQSDNPSYIYSMTPDGHDVFFATQEKLVGSDVVGSPSIYDARVDGGFPEEKIREPCQGDACQPLPGPAPERSGVTTGVPNPGNVTQPAKWPCPKGRRSVKKNGRTHCVKRHNRKRKRASGKRRAAR